MVVMVGPASAGGAEIFAAAMQNYGRAIVVGQPSPGHGTVQTLQRLDHVFKTPETPSKGQLMLTIALYYRVTGGGIQQRGVVPEVALPVPRADGVLREAERDNALPWNRIAPLEFTRLRNLAPVIAALQLHHKDSCPVTDSLAAVISIAADFAARE